MFSVLSYVFVEIIWTDGYRAIIANHKNRTNKSQYFNKEYDTVLVSLTIYTDL